LVRAVPTVSSVPLSLQTAELGNELARLRRLVDAIEARFQISQEEKEKAIEALQKEKDEVLAKL